jgi:hypothetical protein
MLTAREKLGRLLKIPEGCSIWRDDIKYYHLDEDPHGSVNFSPGWFAQGHDVSASAHRI